MPSFYELLSQQKSLSIDLIVLQQDRLNLSSAVMWNILKIGQVRWWLLQFIDHKIHFLHLSVCQASNPMSIC